MKSRNQVLKKLFLSTLYLSAFTFGGGYVIVTQHSWLSLQEFADLVAMAAIFAVCLVLLRKTKLSPILVMLLARQSAAAGIAGRMPGRMCVIPPIWASALFRRQTAQ